MITIQNQNFGVEIELTGISRQAAAQVIADYYGTIGTRFMGTVYKTYEAVDNKGRRWKCMRDASITPQRRVNGHVVDAKRRSSLEEPCASALATMTKTSTGAMPFNAPTNRLPNSSSHTAPGQISASAAPISRPMAIRRIKLVSLYWAASDLTALVN